MKALTLKAIFTLTLIAVTTTIQAADLISHWDFDEGSGTYAFDNGGYNPGTFTGDPGYTNDTPSGSGYALASDNNDYVAMGRSAALNFEGNEAFSVVGWVYRNDAGADCLISKHSTDNPFRGWSVELNANHAIRFLLWSDWNSATRKEVSVISANNTLSVGAWIHVAVTYDGSTDAGGVTLYKNGVAIAGTIQNDSLSTGTTKTTVPVNIGGRNNTSVGLNGCIDDVAVYSGVLTVTEIQNIMNNGVPEPDKPTPLSHWRFDEGSGTTARDHADGNDGTLTGHTTYTNEAAQGKALYFDNVGDYVNVGDKDNLDFERTDAFSIVGWAKAESLSGQDYLISKEATVAPHQGWAVRLGGSGVIDFILWSDNASYQLQTTAADGTVSLNTWLHIAVTYDGSAAADGVRIYKDGVALGVLTYEKDTLTAGSTVTSIPVQIGGRNNLSDMSFHGILDEVAVYDTILTSRQIHDIKNDGIPKFGTMINIQ